MVASTDSLTRQRLGGRQVDVAVGLRCSVPITAGNSKALASLESLVWDVMGLVPVTGTVAGPRTDTSGQSDVYVVDLTTVVTASEKE